MSATDTAPRTWPATFTMDGCVVQAHADSAPSLWVGPHYFGRWHKHDATVGLLAPMRDPRTPEQGHWKAWLSKWATRDTESLGLIEAFAKTPEEATSLLERKLAALRDVLTVRTPRRARGTRR